MKKILIVLSVVFMLFLLYLGILIVDSYVEFDLSYELFYAKLDIELERNTDAVKMHQPLFGSDLIKVINSTNELCEYTVISNYDDEYFKNNALVLIYVERSSGSHKVIPTEVKVENNKMTVKYEVYHPEVGTCDMAYWYIFVECSKEEAANLDKIVVYGGLTKVGELTK